MLGPLDSAPPRSEPLAVVRRLFADYAWTYRRRYAVAFVLMATAAGCTAFSAYLIGEVINQAYVQKNLRAIVWLSLLSVVLFAVKGLAMYGQAVILARIGNRIIADNQRRMFAKLLEQNVGYFADRHSSEFIARLNGGAVSASALLNLIITAFGRDLLSLIGLLAVMVYQDPVMSLAALVVLPPAILVLRKLIRRARNVAYSQFVGGTRILETLQETIHGIRIVKAFTLEDEMRQRMAGNVAEVEAASNKMARIANRASPLMETLGGFAIALVILYGGYRVIVTGATPGAFFSFITAFLLAYEPAKRLARLNIDVSSSLVAIRMLFEVIDSPSTETPETERPALKLSTARIELADVSFAYRSDEPVLHEVSLIAEPGRLTALVGPSGGGKSTVLNLILRLREANAGVISIDGQDIAALSRQSLRQQTAYVGQETFLFRGTIRDNIAFGRPGADGTALIAAARAAHAHDFIVGFPQGYDTPVGEHGLNLSGGQRQRIAIARALLKDAPIILLDEPTAALDSESEKLVHDAIERLTEGRTSIMIAHQLRTVMRADRIHVLEAGRVVESGRHDELLRRGGRDASFYRLQLQHQDISPPTAIATA
jgi:ATP-binding cassette subfamily B protein